MLRAHVLLLENLLHQPLDLLVGGALGEGLEIRREGAHQAIVLGRVPPQLPRRESALREALEERMRHRRVAHHLLPEGLNERRWRYLGRRHVASPMVQPKAWHG